MNPEHQYRAMLEEWLKWWEGAAREYGLCFMPQLPPHMDTRRLLYCKKCGGKPIDKCPVCGRDPLPIEEEPIKKKGRR